MIDYRKVINLKDIKNLKSEELKAMSYAYRKNRDMLRANDIINPDDAEMCANNTKIERVGKNNIKCAKALVACRTVISNPETFINLLLDNNISYEQLKSMVTYIEYLKSITSLNLPFFEDEVDDILNMLCDNIAKILNLEITENIVNRMVDIVAFDKELYYDVEKERQCMQKKMN